MWPFKKHSRSLDTWPIVRCGPKGKIYGKSISVFINNLQCHLATVDVYESGAIDCWGAVERHRVFENEAGQRWVVAAPKDQQKISVFHFGSTIAREGQWWQTSTSIAEEIDFVLGSLANHTRANHELGKPSRFKNVYRRVPGKHEDILGESVHVLHPMEDGFELTRLSIFADGLLQLGTNGELIPIVDSVDLFVEDKLVNHAPENSLISFPGLGEFRTVQPFGNISADDCVGEVHDRLRVLNGEPSVTAICAQRFEEYKREPSKENKDALRAAYYAVPTHLRRYCGDMDTRDRDIYAVLQYS